MKKPLFIALALPLLFPAAGFADTYILKSGRAIYGKLLEKKGDVYIVREAKTGDVLSVPAGQLSIADIDPASEVLPKGTISILGGDNTEGASKSSAPVSVVTSATPSSDAAKSPIPHFANSGLLKLAEDTVKQSNESTAQTMEQLNKMKELADSASGIKPE